VEVLPGEEDAEDIVAEVVLGCGGKDADVGEGGPVMIITGVELALEETCGSAGCWGVSAKSWGAAEEEQMEDVASDVAGVLSGFEEFDELVVSEGRLFIH
jgi:hypothetical protein